MNSSMRWMWVVLLSGACGGDAGQSSFDPSPPESSGETSPIEADGARLPARRLTQGPPVDRCAIVLTDDQGHESYVSEAVLEHGEDGFVRDVEGRMLAGYAVDDAGHAVRDVAALRLLDDLPPVATSELGYTVHLNINEWVFPTPFDPRDPAATSNFSTGGTLFYAQGWTALFTVYYHREAPRVWSWHVLEGYPGAIRDDGSQGPVRASGKLLFGPDGRLANDVVEHAEFPIDWGGAVQTVAFDFRGTQTGNFPSSTNAVRRTGHAARTVFAHDIDDQGFVRAFTSEGKREPKGMLAFAVGNAQDGYEVAPVNIDAAPCRLTRSFVDDDVFDLRADLPE